MIIERERENTYKQMDIGIRETGSIIIRKVMERTITTPIKISIKDSGRKMKKKGME